MTLRRRRWSVHLCFLDERDLRSNRLWRVHFNTPWFHLGLAFTPNSSFARFGGNLRIVRSVAYFRRHA